jgi:hypothetical protein
VAVAPQRWSRRPHSSAAVHNTTYIIYWKSTKIHKQSIENLQKHNSNALKIYQAHALENQRHWPRKGGKSSKSKAEKMIKTRCWFYCLEVLNVELNGHQ